MLLSITKLFSSSQLILLLLTLVLMLLGCFTFSYEYENLSNVSKTISMYYFVFILPSFKFTI